MTIDERLDLLTERHDGLTQSLDPIYPNDAKLVMTVDYYVDHEIFWKPRGLFDRTVSAVAYVHGELAATAVRSMKELQIF